MKILKSLFLLAIIGFFCSVLGVLGMYLYLKPDLPSVDLLKEVKLQTPMRIFTKDGYLISQYGVKRRIPLTLDEIPETLVQAVIATEDSRFYSHIGIDPIGVMRAAVNLITTGERGQGASTLTMQLARGFFLTNEKTFSRKIREVFIALHMEQELTKEEILTLYLNKVELGHRAFGVGAAAQVYYGRSIKNLTLAEIATIAGLPQAPSVLNPISRPARSVERRRIVLLRMLDEEYINRAQFDEAANAAVTAKKHGAEIDLDAPYLADLIYNEMVSIYGKEIAETSGFDVYATASHKLQAAAQDAVVQNLHDYDERHGYRGPLKQLWKPADPVALADSGLTLPLSVTDAQKYQQDVGFYEPWTREQILEELATTQSFKPLLPAVVISVAEQSINVVLANGTEQLIEWDGLDWARKYISDSAQGPEPEVAKEIVSEGMLIYVRFREQDSVWQLAQYPAASSAFIALNPTNGAVEAVVGGYSFYQSQFNRATQAKRQIGSNVKPFVYSAALNNGYTVASIINDAPINQWDANSGVAWRPQNSPAVYNGPIRMRVALGQSKNVVSVRLLRGVGLDNLVSYLQRFGFQNSDIPRDETLSLGSGSHTPMELASGIATIANGGFAVKPYLIERIESDNNEVIWQAEPEYACDPCSVNQDTPAIDDLEAMLAAQFSDKTTTVVSKAKQSAPRVISEQNAFLVADIMRTAVRSNGNWNKKTYWLGTGWRANNLIGRDDIGGKTGTTNDSRDTWFSGFAPNLVATAWVGFDDSSQQLGRATRNQNLINKNPEKFNWIGNAMIGAEDGAKAAQPAWIRFMQQALVDVPEQTAIIPEGIVRIRIDRESGKLTRKTDHTSMFEYFEKGSEPTSYVVESELSLPFDDIESEYSIPDDIF